MNPVTALKESRRAPRDSQFPLMSTCTNSDWPFNLGSDPNVTHCSGTSSSSPFPDAALLPGPGAGLKREKTNDHFSPSENNYRLF